MPVKHASIIVRADWDDEAKVWVASSADVAGLAIEAETLEALEPKVIAALEDLLELNGGDFEGRDIPVHIVTQQLSRVSNPSA